MKLYVWRSKAMQDWTEGWIVVAANSADGARIRARVEWRQNEMLNKSISLEELEADIAGEPVVQHTGAVLIWGSG